MKNKKITLLFVILAIAIVSVVLYFISRPQHQEFLPQTFAQLPEKPKPIAKFHNGPSIKSVAFSPVDSSIIATADQYGTVKLWNTNDSNNPVRIFSHPALSTLITFSPSGKLLVSSDFSKVILWDVATGKKLNSLNGSSGQIAFSPDGNILAIPKAHVKLWDIRDPDNLTEIGILPYEPPEGIHNWGARALDISPDGKWIASAHNNGTVNVWDFQSKQLVKTLEPTLELKTSHERIETIKFSPDNRYLAICAYSANCILWTVPEWKHHGEINRGLIAGLAFSPDGKMCAFANPSPIMGKGIELRLAANGAPITSLPIETWGVAFSYNGEMLATGGEDGFLRLWRFKPNISELVTTSFDVIKIMYIIGPGENPQNGISSKLDRMIREVQKYYADEMERHGFGRKTFTFETDENGKAKIYLIKAEQTKNLDFSNVTWLAGSNDYNSFFNFSRQNNFAGYRYNTFEYYPWIRGTTSNKIRGKKIEGVNYGQLIYASARTVNHDTVAYELLRSAFNLPNVDRKLVPNFLTRINAMKLSKCEVEWLDRSRFLNPNQPFFDKRPKIEMKVSQVDTSDSRLFQFSIADMDGIHQVQLFVPIDIKNQRWRKKFYECQALEGKDKATVEFEISDPEIKTVALRMIDMHGNIASREFRIKDKEP